jgi:PAS domain S-box-containing protein
MVWQGPVGQGVTSKPVAALGSFELPSAVRNTILDTINDAVYVRDLKRKLLYVNPAAERLSGWSAQEALAQPCYKTFGDPGEACHRACPIDHCIQRDQSLHHQEGRVVKRDGSVIDARVSIAPLKDGDSVIGSVVVLQDISELRASEERIKDFADAASDWLWETDENLRFIDISGRPPVGPRGNRARTIGLTREDIADTEYNPEEWQQHRTDLAARRPFSNFQYRRIGIEGESVVDIRVSGKPLFDGNGRFCGYRGVGSNITALLTAERRARSAQLRQAAAMDGISEILALWDTDDRLVLANRAIREINDAAPGAVQTGMTYEAHVRAVAAAGLFPDAVGNEEAWIRWRIERHRGLSGPFELQRQNGTVLLVNEHRIPDGGILTIGTDITERKRGEAALSESEERFRKVAQSAREAIVSVDSHGRIVFWNDGAKATFGYTAEEVDQQSFFMLAPERHRADHHELFAKVVKGDPAGLIDNTVEGKGLRKDGTEIPLEISYSEWTLGGERFYTAIIRDVSARKAAEHEAARSQHELALHLENTPMAATGWDTNLVCTSWNRAAEEVFGYTAAEAIGRSSVDLIVPEAIRDEVSAVLGEVMAESIERYRVNENVTKDGHLITCEWFNTPLIDGDGSVIGIAALARDISEKLEADEELRLAKEAADSANVAKSEFVSSISHELRTPLNAILGFTQLLRDYSDEPLTTEQSTYIEQIFDGGRHLLSLVNDVLDLSRIEAGRLALSLGPVAVPQAIEECLALVQPLADQREIVITVNTDGGPEMHVTADRGRLKQVILNLLSNAVKYNRDQGAVTVSTSSNAAGPLRISVADTGPGIAAEDYEAVFKPFSRLGADKTDIEGTGIGLTISRRLIESMAGRLELQSTLGEGSTFWIEIPLAET